MAEPLRSKHGVYYRHMNFGAGYGMGGMGWNVPGFLPVAGIALVALLLWSFVWKGLALWHSAKRNDKGWFIFFLVINTAGILEIIYLLFIMKEPVLRGYLGIKKS